MQGLHTIPLIPHFFRKRNSIFSLHMKLSRPGLKDLNLHWLWWLNWNRSFLSLKRKFSCSLSLLDLSKASICFFQLRQLAMPVNFEAEPHQEGRSRMFSDNEVFSFLYGKTRPQEVNKDVVSAQSVTQASNTGKLRSDITFPCKILLTHAQLRRDRLEHAWHSRQIQYWQILKYVHAYVDIYPSNLNIWYTSNFWICTRNLIPFNAIDTAIIVSWHFATGTFSSFPEFWHSCLLVEKSGAPNEDIVQNHLT